MTAVLTVLTRISFFPFLLSTVILQLQEYVVTSFVVKEVLYTKQLFRHLFAPKGLTNQPGWITVGYLLVVVLTVAMIPIDSYMILLRDNVYWMGMPDQSVSVADL